MTELLDRWCFSFSENWGDDNHLDGLGSHFDMLVENLRS